MTGRILLVVMAAALAGCSDPEEAATVAEESAPVHCAATGGKPVVYQVFTRLFGNTNTTNKPWGTLEENGVGKFADFTDEALSGICELGTSHVWYTGMPHHAVIRDYRDVGISDDDPDIVKGRAGSPYAVKDYYNVNPDLAVDPANRLEEFRALVERTHAHGMKVIIDIVPNHVARGYESLSAPDGVRDFGADDDTSVEWARDNNFYYVVGEDFRIPAFRDGYEPLGGEPHPLVDGEFDESPAKWTGNGARAAQPGFDDWYETVKVNFGVRPDGSHAFETLPDEAAGWTTAEHGAFWADKDVPDSWLKFRDIVLYWTDFGVDGFRFDMAEMVPVEFWSYLNSSIKAVNPDAFLLAEVYNPSLYRDYLRLGRMDYLYDKVEFYDTLKLVMQGTGSTDDLPPIQARLADIEEHMLHFLENHDEQRIASPGFAGDATKGRPAMVVSATISRSPTMLYFGQDVGEPGEGDAGFGDPTRTTIFDYWGVPAHQRWMNGGKFDGGGLRDDERALRDFYTRLMRFTATNPAMLGAYAEIHTANRETTEGYDDKLLSFVRWRDDERLIVVSNFSADAERAFDLVVPASIIAGWMLADGRYRLDEVLSGGQDARLIVDGGQGIVRMTLGPLESAILRIGEQDIVRHPNVSSAFVDPRHVDVWLPAGYHGSDAAYDVLYAHDGQNLFNPSMSYTGVDWGIDETLQSLDEDGIARPTIVVGIWNTPLRFNEYLPHDAWLSMDEATRTAVAGAVGGEPVSREYLRFIVEELKPFIDAHYRTNPERAHTYLMGSSMGGLISQYGLVRHPDVFSAALCLSTHWPFALEVNDLANTSRYVEFLRGTLPPPGEHRFYYDFGTEELDSFYEPHQLEIDALMIELGYTHDSDWLTRKFEGASHNESYWQQRLHIPLTFLFTE